MPVLCLAAGGRCYMELKLQIRSGCEQRACHCASIGLTAHFVAVPLGYEFLKFTGALYLLWLA